MGPDPILAQHLGEQKLQVGQQVVACWSNGLGRQRAPARLVALKPRTLVVELLRAAGGYPAGRRLELPRISDFERWSSDYGVRCEPASSVWGDPRRRDGVG